MEAEALWGETGTAEGWSREKYWTAHSREGENVERVFMEQGEAEFIGLAREGLKTAGKRLRKIGEKMIKLRGKPQQD